MPRVGPFFVSHGSPCYALGRVPIPEDYEMFEARGARRLGGWPDSDPSAENSRVTAPLRVATT
jgi:hypothetical protein